MSRLILAVDPGIDFGWAVVEDFAKRRPRVVEWGVENAGKGEWEERALKTFDAFHGVLTGRHADVVCEWPEFFDSAGGAMVARRGDLGKLHAIAGGFMAMSHRAGRAFHHAPVHLWKGQLPKRVVNDRIMKTLKVDKHEFKSHAWDAVGIGLWHLGKF